MAKGRFLDERNVFATRAAAPLAAAARAGAAESSGFCGAKTVIVRLNGELAMAVVGNGRHVDFKRLAEQTGAEEARQTTQAEFSARFIDCDGQCVPPFGHLFGMTTFMDRQLADEEFISFRIGERNPVIVMKFLDYLTMTPLVLVRIAADTSPLVACPLSA